MTQKERLVELIIQSVDGCARHWAEIIADYLLSNGVIVPPCKVGDTVWGLWYTPMSKEYFIQPSVVDTLTFAMDDWCVHTEDGFTFTKVQFKNDWFSDREEAEKALKEQNDEN